MKSIFNPGKPGFSCMMMVLVFICITPFLFAATEGLPGDNAKLKVTIMIFSGRPNPTFYIDDQFLVDNLVGHFAKNTKLTAFGKKSVVPNKLGYTGILIENLKDIKGLPKRFMIYGKDMEAPETNEFFTDNSGLIETSLLDHAYVKNAINSELRDIIQRERK